MLSVIRVQPAPHLRRAFAVWAIAQTPKIRTVSESAFGVPPERFPAIPEHLLAGAFVDGRQLLDLLLHAAPVLPELEAEPGEALPEIDPAAYPPGAVPLPRVAPEEDAPPAEEPPGAAPDGDGGETPCGHPGCQRTFRNERAASAHRRQAHTETKG